MMRRTALFLTLFLTAGRIARSGEGPGSPGCREATRQTYLSSAAAGGSLAGCLLLKSREACIMMPVAGAQFAHDYAKMRQACAPRPPQPKAP